MRTPQALFRRRSDPRSSGVRAQREKSGYEGEVDVEAHLAAPGPHGGRSGGRGGRGGDRGGRGGGRGGGRDGGRGGGRDVPPFSPPTCRRRLYAGRIPAWVLASLSPLASTTSSMQLKIDSAGWSLTFRGSQTQQHSGNQCGDSHSRGNQLLRCKSDPPPPPGGHCHAGGGRGAAKKVAKDSKYGFGGPKRAGGHFKALAHT